MLKRIFCSTNKCVFNRDPQDGKKINHCQRNTLHIISQECASKKPYYGKRSLEELEGLLGDLYYEREKNIKSRTS